MTLHTSAIGAGRLTLAVEGAVATLTLVREPVNAIDDAMLDALFEAFAQVAADPAIAVLRIRSAGKLFCAGADLALVGTRLDSPAGADDMVRTVRRFHEVYDRLAALPAVTLAEIEGHALGGGLELALACDLRIAAHEARLGLPEAKVGLLPGAGGTQRLTRLCGPGVAARIILTGELVGGAEAERLGLVQWAVPAAEVRGAADAVVARTAALSAAAIRTAKGCIGLVAALPEAGARAEIDGIGALMREPDTHRRVSAFLGR
ncbi:enoyl-CoA hydratase/isomerase family protein [Xanthobacter autotrophicus DSM 431]|uniref:enoyl-CoA hydratase/isomerase family protein n=1 Tax=Xanthobacter nonsaccharivorans TaxID=3119912 RepID=UPI00372A07E7